MNTRRLLLLLATAGALLACSSPEATRVRAGGPGADVGNRSETVQLHEGSRPYEGTPRIIGDVGMTDLEPAQQAYRLSRREP
jgi:hypothetical protein